MTLIVIGQRAQTIHCMRVSDIKLLDNRNIIPIMSVIKQTYKIKRIKPTKRIQTLCFQAYDKEPKLCASSNLTKYLKIIKSCKHTNKLFLNCIKPYRAEIRILYLGGAN